MRGVRGRGAEASGQTWRALWFAGACLIALPGCSTPAARLDALAQSAGFERAVVEGTAYRHVVYRHGSLPATAGVLRVYIEGDGRAYLDRWTVAPDPTPLTPVMLQLMAMDPLPAIYLGRPCYLGLATDPSCSPVDWTLGRFSPSIVASMAAVIEQAARGADAIELYGHSGGGTLAVLLARRLDRVTRVITLAGNLDPAAWAALHGYTALHGSEMPLAGGPLRAEVVQVHYAGGRDRNVPPALLAAAVPQLGAGRLVVIADADHTCCWSSVWPAALAGQVAAETQRNW